MLSWNEIYPWILAALGGALGAAALLPTRWGEALIQRRTNELLEEYKSSQSRELERLKADQTRELEHLKADQSRGLERLKEQLNHLGDRGRRSNEMEFAAIETAWKAFVRAWLSTNTCVGAMIDLPDFNRMSDEEVKKFATASGFSDRDQETLVSSTDKQDIYAKLVNWHNVIEARKDIYQARLTLREQRIFMPPELTKIFSDVIERMSSVQVERQLALQHPDASGDLWKVSSKWIADCQFIFEDLANQANKRLFRGERDTAR